MLLTKGLSILKLTLPRTIWSGENEMQAKISCAKSIDGHCVRRNVFCRSNFDAFAPDCIDCTLLFKLVVLGSCHVIRWRLPNAYDYFSPKGVALRM